MRDAWRRIGAVSAVVVGALLSGACGPKDEAPPASVADEVASAFTRLPTPPESSLTADAFSRAVRRGRALLNATPESLPQHVGNTLRCTSCHLDNGTRALAMPWVGVYARFPQFRARSGNVDAIEDRVNDCFKRSLNGRALNPAGRDMKDIVTYYAWLSRGTAVGARTKGQGIDSIGLFEGDKKRGATVFATSCTRCHGADGQGITIRSHPSLWAPPLWGPRSFSIGAGMARVRVAAAFIHRHMPFDRLVAPTEGQAFDVAAFVTGQPRPDFPGKEYDWPNGDPPPDVAYATLKKRAGP